MSSKIVAEKREEERGSVLRDDIIKEAEDILQEWRKGKDNTKIIDGVRKYLKGNMQP